MTFYKDFKPPMFPPWRALILPTYETCMRCFGRGWVNQDTVRPNEPCGRCGQTGQVKVGQYNPIRALQWSGIPDRYHNAALAIRSGMRITK